MILAVNGKAGSHCLSFHSQKDGHRQRKENSEKRIFPKPWSRTAGPALKIVSMLAPAVIPSFAIKGAIPTTTSLEAAFTCLLFYDLQYLRTAYHAQNDRIKDGE